MIFDITRQQRLIIRALQNQKDSAFDRQRFYNDLSILTNKRRFKKSLKPLSEGLFVSESDIDFQSISSACLDLVEKLYLKNLVFRNEHDQCLISSVALDYKGLTLHEQYFLAILNFLLKSILVPIAVSVITTLITMRFTLR